MYGTYVDKYNILFLIFHVIILWEHVAIVTLFLYRRKKETNSMEAKTTQMSWSQLSFEGKTSVWPQNSLYIQADQYSCILYKSEIIHLLS